jgi:hypothetical protein
VSSSFLQTGLLPPAQQVVDNLYGGELSKNDFDE